MKNHASGLYYETLPTLIPCSDWCSGTCCTYRESCWGNLDHFMYFENIRFSIDMYKFYLFYRVFQHNSYRFSGEIENTYMGNNITMHGQKHFSGTVLMIQNIRREVHE